MTLEELNGLSEEACRAFFTQTCATQSWVALMSQSRPFVTKEAVLKTARSYWQEMNNDDFLEAFAAHPMIGDINTLRSKYANTKAVAAGEQSGTAVADDNTLLALKKGNDAYLKKHGFIFIICATGLSANTMLDALNKRLNNSTEEEIQNAAAEQIKITCLRLDKALAI
ncbi:2-oxo-4-hydroxy-4-carboxy-5-ureidoimidazoline decarboxylase [Aestuariibacter sp. A3R04]|uniref:2-oxo-4-hydroxy-4-carboxy-5-ureidoimidazoline decarboxylase n=1 Tax=Aestuariibacter sp. A3R04 TaxID=2841571 RepID=UPI001C09C23C|nr:2-oxo-4-hydroxy-4-carboxy-5-ureidoimidazoline decarboxylase [Aestuariibacter sp. A3R04]MBU3022624.1 2-oxo-4-hydroxy-4-carboxy-5-ureidoimidazoline decarboxylase [Aestuariibacter sp. A3R04]